MLHLLTHMHSYASTCARMHAHIPLSFWLINLLNEACVSEFHWNNFCSNSFLCSIAVLAYILCFSLLSCYWLNIIIPCFVKLNYSFYSWTLFQLLHSLVCFALSLNESYKSILLKPNYIISDFPHNLGMIVATGVYSP